MCAAAGSIRISSGRRRLSGMTTWILVGYLVLPVVTIWLIYRIARGWIYLVDGKEMYQQTTGENNGR
jgi:uncharacterized membrane protein